MLDLSLPTKKNKAKKLAKNPSFWLFMLVLAQMLYTLCGCTPVPHASVAPLELRQEGTSLGSASAFAISPFELITADHVCEAVQDQEGAELFSPTLGTLDILAREPETDLCLLSSHVAMAPLRIAKYATVHMDDKASILGFPLGIGQILTSGTVANPYYIAPNGRALLLLSVPAMAGNSGSPILNSSGEVIGVLSMGIMRYPQVTFAVTGHDLSKFIAWAHGE